MGSHGIHDKVAIVGMGCTNFAERWDKGSTISSSTPHRGAFTRPASARTMSTPTGSAPRRAG